MDRFNALGRGAQAMLVAGVLLFIALLLPWQDFEGLGVITRKGWYGIGVVLGLLTIALVAWLVVRLLSVDIPLPLSTAMISAILGGLVLIFAIIKILTILGDDTTIWAWIGLILAVVVGVGAWLEVQAGGGVATLRSEIPTSSSASTSTTTSTATAPPPPPPPSEPEAAPPPVEPAPPAEPAEPSYPPEPETPPEREEERRDL